ncbi:putative acetyltransferase [Frigoribacterium sp. PvP120]|uniref:GNAT family N-acetyltransferase n=1 Tax=unclassified Frigoribacterium TaxID=2627005 RepID=UPI001AE4EE97|nr:GNAT family N-acetyltransferase [Frigoribacterium sp. PvP121]MBP1240465.1 putative acetyltransferase [Frigoribacterium sp. PvP121]
MAPFDDDFDIRSFPAALEPTPVADAGDAADGAAGDAAGDGAAPAEPRADADSTAWTRAVTLGFHNAEPDAGTIGRETQRGVVDGRLYTGVYAKEAREGSLAASGVPVGTFVSLTRSINVGGGRLLDAHLVSGVTVQPTYRRRGILRRLMTDDLAAAKGAGLAVAALTASEGVIYRRFGFGPATRERKVEVDRRRASGLLSEPAGSVDLVARDEAFEATAREVFARFHRRSPGSIDRHEGVWSHRLHGGRPGGVSDPAIRAAVHRDPAGAVDGYVTYKLDEGATTVLIVTDLVAASDDAYLGLWQLLLEVDLVDTVRYEQAPQADPLLHALVDPRAMRITHDEDHVWLRVLDPVAALQARPWSADGVVTLAVADALGHAAGTFRVTSEGGSATVKRAGVRRADLDLDVATLGSLWLGGVDPVTLAGAGLVRERRAGAVQSLRAMLAPDRPLHGITSF